MKLPISIGSLLKGKGGAGGITQGFKDIQINIFREGYHVQARRLPGYALLGVLSVVALGSLFWIYQGYSDSNSDTTKLRSELDQIERKIKSMQSSTATNGTADVPMIDDEVKAEALKAARDNIRGGSDGVVPIVKSLTETVPGAPTFSSIKFQSNSREILLDGLVKDPVNLISYARAVQAEPEFSRAGILSLGAEQQMALITPISETANGVIEVTERGMTAQSGSGGPVEIVTDLISGPIGEDEEDTSMSEDQASASVDVGKRPVAEFVGAPNPDDTCPSDGENEELPTQVLPDGGLRVVFIDKSHPPCDDEGQPLHPIYPIVSWQWDFGDGTTSTLQSPIHDYKKEGKYTVTLTVTDSQGRSGSTSTGMFDKPVADFTAALPSCANPLTVKFTDLTTTVTEDLISWKWDFDYHEGDEEEAPGSSTQNPTYTYSESGAYVVTLTVEGTSRTPATVKKLVKPSTPPSAGFSVRPVSGDSSMVLRFTDESTPGDRVVGNSAEEAQVEPAQIALWQWDFGDGATSTEQNPTHAYSTPGLYTVTLKVVENDGNCSTKVKTVKPGSGLTADFSATSSSTKGGGLKVQFTDESSVTDPAKVSWLWDFGDGGTSTSENPIHTYATVGTYTVTLRVTEEMGAATGAESRYAVSAVTAEIRIDELMATPFSIVVTR